jgi:dihydroorotate dehydrogenase (fumarate)
VAVGWRRCANTAGAPGHLTRSFAAAEPAGLACFKRFYQPELDVDTREMIPRVELSTAWELRLPLR